MKYLTKILEEEYDALDKIVSTKKGIKLAEHALNLGPQVNIKKFLELCRMHEDIAVIREHLKNDDEVDGSKSVLEMIKFSLRNYDNRTIEVGEPDYEKFIGRLEHHRNIDFVANYKYWSFEPLDIQKWRMHSPESGERLLLYALDTKNYKNNRQKAEENQRKALVDVSKELGVFVADKPKKYMKWVQRTYKINAKEGMHMRPSSEIIQIANKYNGDVWLRTESNEVIGKSIMSLLMLGITSDKEITVLYKPMEGSAPFFRDLESVKYTEGKPLLTRLR